MMPFIVRFSKCVEVVAITLEYGGPSLATKTLHIASEVIALLKALPKKRIVVTLLSIIDYERGYKYITRILERINREAK